MKTTVLSFALAAFVAGSLPAFADDTFIAEQKLTEYLAKDRLIGAKVKGTDGKIVGDIEDLIINSDNQVVGAIMGVGGFLGVGEKKVAVSIKSFGLEVTDGKMNVTMPTASKDVLTAAPAYKRISAPKGWFQRAVEKGQELKDKSSVTAKDAVEKAKQNAGPALESAKEKAKEVIESAKEKAHDAVEKAKEAAKPSAPAEAPKQ
ncbi:MAG: PRC-barrel domain-containing protein [Hyphomicrobium sp.]|nr:photosystem reaction center subunit H [Hyphomicrobium sp.]